jgi:hypothetical protein
MTKTCGECKYYCNDSAFCSRHGVGWKNKSDAACKDFQPIPKITNGDKIIAGGNKALVKFHLLGTCDTCIYYNKEHTSHNDICLCPKDKTCADGIEAWLNAPSASEVYNETTSN